MVNEKINPIFITGTYRSGTTILSRMLDAHPDLNIAYDSVNYFRWFIKTKRNSSDYKNIVTEVADRLKERYDLTLDRERIISNISKNTEFIEHKHIYEAIMVDYMSYSGKTWGEKTVLEWTSIPKFLDMFPKGKALHIIRDPRDVVASFKNMTFEPGNRYLDAIFACMHSMDTAIQYINSLEKEQYFLVNYELLIADPINQIKKICKFLGINFHDSMMDPSKHLDIKGKKLSLKNHSSYGSSKGLPMGKWKTELSNIEINFIEGFLCEQMRRFEYEISNSDNNLHEILNIIKSEDLLLSRFKEYLRTGKGIEEYPSDPKDPKNWTVISNEDDNGAAGRYIRNKT